MKQSRRMSLIEAIANVVVGYGLAVLTQIAVFPLFVWRQLGAGRRVHRNLPGALLRVAESFRSGQVARRRDDDRRA